MRQSHADKLLALAKEAFKDQDPLNDAEVEVVDCVAKGNAAILTTDPNKLKNPSNADLPLVRAQLLVWLVTDRQAVEFISNQGISIVGARITSELDLSFASFPFQFRLISCHVVNSMNLQDANLGFLNLGGSHVMGITADRVRVEGSVFLDDGFHCQGEVRLVGGSIKGDLKCGKGRFERPGGKALDMEGLHIQGHCLMDGMMPFGEVDFTTCRIDRGFSMLQACWDENSVLTLKDASASFVVDDKNSWPVKGNLNLNGFQYETFGDESWFPAKKRIDWLELQPDDRFRPKPYEQLATVYRKGGYEADAQAVMIAKNDKLRWFLKHGNKKKFACWFEKQIRKAKGDERAALVKRKGETLKHVDNYPHWPWYSRVWHRLIGIGARYGYRSSRALFWLLCLVVLGTGLFWLASGLGVMAPSRMQTPAPERQALHADGTDDQRVLPDGYPHFSALLYSLDAGIPLVDLNQKDYWTPDPNWEWNWDPKIFGLTIPIHWFSIYHAIHTFMGWVLTLLLVASVSGLVKNERSGAE